jgi:hypothetical protein
MKARTVALMMKLAGTALAVAAFFGYKCPAQGCPACKIVGK